jgi:hypothetical protein
MFKMSQFEPISFFFFLNEFEPISGKKLGVFP